jgi:iron complex outermembrane receptor protein
MNNRLTTGVDFRRAKYRGDAYNAPYFYSSKYRLCREDVSVYAYDEMTLFDRVVLSVGYRYEYLRDKYYYVDSYGGPYDGVKRRRNYALSAGITYLFGDESKAYFRFSKGYRMPLLEEYVTWSGPNLDLKAERVTGYEIGLEHAFDLFDRDMTLTLSLYWDEYDDELYYDPATYSNLNYDKTVHRGFEIGLNAWPTDWLEVYVNYAYQDAYFDYSPYNGKQVPLVPQNMVTFGFATEYKGFAFNMDCRWLDSRVLGNDLDNAHPGFDSYFVADMRISYTYKWFEAFFGIDNFTDEEYADYFGWNPGSRGDVFEYPLPGITYYGGLAIRF